MSHGLDVHDRMFYVRERPWHGLGIRTEEPLTIAEAIELVGDWDVELRPVYTADADGDPVIAVPDTYTTVRTDLDIPLGVVGARYTPLQNREAGEFLNNVFGGGLKAETAGTLRNGRKVWVAARMPKDILIGGVDPIEPYVAGFWGHDGLLSLTLKSLFIRPVCENTVSMALAEASSAVWKGKHTESLKGRAHHARDVMGVAFKICEDFEREMELLLRTPVNHTTTARFVDALAGPRPEGTESKRGQTMAENRRERLFHLITGAPTQEIGRNTAYGLYNAGVEYLDWVRPVKGGDERRFERNVLSDDSEKARILPLVKSLV